MYILYIPSIFAYTLSKGPSELQNVCTNRNVQVEEGVARSCRNIVYTAVSCNARYCAMLCLSRIIG